MSGIAPTFNPWGGILATASKGRRADGAGSKKWRTAAGRRKKKAAPEAAGPPWKVTEGDLRRLDDVRSLLTALNDAYVSSREIQDLVAKVPVLAARCIRRADGQDFSSHEELIRSLSKIGNMGVESELLGLLEDLTTFQADLHEAEAAESAPPEG